MSTRTGPRPRRRRWTPPVIGTRYVRSADQAVHSVSQVYRANEQVKLTPADGGKPVYVWAYVLDAEYEQVVL